MITADHLAWDKSQKKCANVPWGSNNTQNNVTNWNQSEYKYVVLFIKINYLYMAYIWNALFVD